LSAKKQAKQQKLKRHRDKMSSLLAKRNETRKTRTLRVRRKVRGSAEKPRLSVHKSNRNIFAQLIDDDNRVTLVSYCTLSEDFQDDKMSKKSKEAAKIVGAKIGKSALEKGIKCAVFDRGRFKFHGILAELAQAARDEGLQF